MKTTPITSALKRKYSPFKLTAAEKLQQEIEKQSVIVADPQGKAKKQTTYETPGSKGTPGGTRTDTRLSYKEAWDQNIIEPGFKKGLRDRYEAAGLTFEDYAGGREEQREDDPEGFEADMVAKTNVEGGPGTKTTSFAGSEGTDPSQRQEEKPIYTKVTGTGKRAYESREDLRGGTQAASKSKRAATQKARAEQKLAKMGYDPDSPLKPGDKGYVKQQRLLGKIGKQESRQTQADAEVESFKRMSQEGKTAGQDYYKGQREADIAEVQTPQQQGGTANSNESEDEKKNPEAAGKMRYDMGKFRKMSTKAPLKKLTDLSGDGKVTKKDVLIGRGVINKDGSPAKMGYGNKKTPFKMGGYGKKTYK
jgi:hypothetical protein